MSSNYLSPTGFTVAIDRLPNVEFHTQKVAIPGISASAVNSASPIGALHQAGGQLTFDDLQISFKATENLENYLEIFDWFTGINTPQTTDQYKRFTTTEVIKSDIVVTILNSHKNSNLKVVFTDCFPTALSDVQMDVSDTTVEYPEVSVTFKYNYFTVIRN
jgi:hypothetical protein